MTQNGLNAFQLPKFLTRYVDVAENDGDGKIRAGSKRTHGHKEVVKTTVNASRESKFPTVTVLLDVKVAEWNCVVRIVARHLEIAASVHAH